MNSIFRLAWSRKHFPLCSVSAIATAVRISIVVCGLFGGRAFAGSASSDASKHAKPAAEERAELEKILTEETDPLERAEELSSLLEDAMDQAVKRSAYVHIARAYERVLATAKSSPKIEKRLLTPPLDAETAITEQLSACYSLATSKLGATFVDKCLAVVKASTAAAAHSADIARLGGTISFGKREWAAASTALKNAAASIDCDSDPGLHLRLAVSERERGDKVSACRVASTLYASQPALPGARAELANCPGGADTAAKALAEASRAKLLAGRLNKDILAPTLALEDDVMQAQDVDLSKSGKVTVLAFFSTWCSHCAAEMPRLVAFARELRAKPEVASKVDFLGIRTAVEREAEPYADFAKRYGIAFTVRTDPVMSLALSRFTRALGLAAALPTVAVLDTKGFVRFVLEPGEYKDTARDLHWAVESLLPPVKT